MFNTWMKLAMETSMLAFESQQVIALRMMKLSTGDAASSREAQRMVSEKAFAMGEVALALTAGGSAQSMVRKYRGKVRANRRRLAKG